LTVVSEELSVSIFMAHIVDWRSACRRCHDNIAVRTKILASK